MTVREAAPLGEQWKMIYSWCSSVSLASNPIPKHHQALDNKEMMQNFLSALNVVSGVFSRCLSLNWPSPWVLISLVPHANCCMATYSEPDWIRIIGILDFIDLHFMIWGVRNLGTAQLDTSVVLPVMTWVVLCHLLSLAASPHYW